ncbi:peroxiredoxin [Prolixibacter denitrificans]|uniref:Peroxiredoxin n=1 Tax=Prolixibacter denitrificans TaxID=1541063 RepID=A0A2P8CEV3_9BACT|nr:peroxiredoxin [Prolixibacter denitrificans]PSK83409.1 peroxiredoxin (alkyl hydroperoxide reductase subunit C) [Prolixibacter denitrificans]GET21711.1 peroxiredoxin [Prolixibacter denitrificans]
MEEHIENPMPRIGDKAPDFKATTTYGDLVFSEYNKGSWVILFSHPADFTPVCTTEMSGFATRHNEFKDMNCKLIGLSIDSIHAHVAWVNNVKKNTGVLFDFPIIADLDMHVAMKYGMIMPGEATTAAVRAVFIIDPNGIIRLIMYYPLNVGRNMDEIVRALKALQTADKHKVALPLNWQPGEKVIVPPPTSVEAMEEREKSDFEMVDFYLAKKNI